MKRALAFVVAAAGALGVASTLGAQPRRLASRDPAAPLAGADAGPVSDAGPPPGMGPVDILAAYAIPTSAKASGAIIAILDTPDSNAYADLTTYRTKFQLPPLPRCASGHGGPGTTACFSQVNEDGGPSTGKDSGYSDIQTSLDMDMVSAACPDCSILLVEIAPNGNLQNADFVAGSRTAAALGAVATSIAFGSPEGYFGDGGDPTGYTTPGHLVLASSGMNGYDNATSGGSVPDYPASSPDVVAVGGTEVFRAPSGAYDEAVWNDGIFYGNQSDVTTSGCSSEFAIPPWQIGPTNGACGARRATVDLAAVAEFTSAGKSVGIAAYSTASGWTQVLGTAASTPIAAAILTRVGVAVWLSEDLGRLYSPELMAAMNDLGSPTYLVDPAGKSTNASDAGCAPAVMCNVAPGWDGPSGVGTPNGVKLFQLGDAIAHGAYQDAGTPPAIDAGADTGGGPPPAPLDDGAVGPSPPIGAGEAGANADTGSFPRVEPACTCTSGVGGGGRGEGGASIVVVAGAVALAWGRRRR